MESADWRRAPVQGPLRIGDARYAYLHGQIGLRSIAGDHFGNDSSPSNEYGGTGQLGTPRFCCEREGNDTHTLVAALSWVKGKHSLKFGFDGLMYRLGLGVPSYPGGVFNYNFTSTSEFPFSGGGDAIASFLTGVGGPGGVGRI